MTYYSLLFVSDIIHCIRILTDIVILDRTGSVISFLLSILCSAEIQRIRLKCTIISLYSDIII